MNPPDGLQITETDRDSATFTLTADLTRWQRAMDRLGAVFTMAKAARLDAARVAAARQDPELPLGADRDLAMVYAYGPSAVSMAGPDERAVLVRASYLLDHGTDPADVTTALATWADRFPHLVGTAPRVHTRTEYGYRAEPTGVIPRTWSWS